MHIHCIGIKWPFKFGQHCICHQELLFPSLKTLNTYLQIICTLFTQKWKYISTKCDIPITTYIWPALYIKSTKDSFNHSKSTRDVCFKPKDIEMHVLYALFMHVCYRRKFLSLYIWNIHSVLEIFNDPLNLASTVNAIRNDFLSNLTTYLLALHVLCLHRNENTSLHN